MSTVLLEKSVDLGEGISLHPPSGWTQSGWVTDNPLWLNPKDRMDWMPPGAKSAVLHWEMSASPLPEDVMAAFIELLKGKSEPLSIQQILPLYPALVRMEMDAISRAQVLYNPDSESVLCVQYAINRTQEFGVVFYGLTKGSALGEFQMVCYEGKGPEYGQFFEAGKAALNSFRTKQVPDFSLKRAPQSAPAGAEVVKRSKFGALKPEEAAPPAPPQTTHQVPSEEPQARAQTLAEKYAAKHLGKPQENAKEQTAPAAETQIVKKKKATAEVPMMSEVSPGVRQPQERKPRRRTAELKTLKVIHHVLQPGETIKGLVGQYWPNIGEREAEARLKEIYALNRIHKNICWNQKPGQTVMLPGD